LFLGGCLLLSLITFFSWRKDRALLANGREIQAQIIDRQTKFEQDCDDYGCTSEINYYLTYQFVVQDETFTREQVVDSGIYERAESSISVLYLPERPATSNVAETANNSLPLPLFSLIAIVIGLLGGAIIYWIS
jgi:hypothetical protein